MNYENCLTLLLFLLLVAMVSVVSVEIWFRALCYIKEKNVMYRYRIAALNFMRAKGDLEKQKTITRFSLYNIAMGLSTLFLTLVSGALVYLPWFFWGSVRDAQYYYWGCIAVGVVGYFFVQRKKMLNVLEADPVRGDGVGSMLNNYSFLAQVLHWVALDVKSAREMAFYLDLLYCKLFKRKKLRAIRGGNANGPVYVCGLARSGTTVLLETLDLTRNFASLTYRVMPFVMCPNIWRFISGQYRFAHDLRERAHGDGVLVGLDSPECFEEVYWKTFSQEKKFYRKIVAVSAQGEKNMEVKGIRQNVYSFGVIDKNAMKKFGLYRDLVILCCVDDQLGERKVSDEGASCFLGAHGVEKRYLSKNNNNLMRIESLASEKNSHVLIVYRNPFETAFSLYRQHERFCQSQTKDPFVLDYMTWLGHHEFGLDHRPFKFALPYMSSPLTPDSLDYWLEYWTAVYTHVIREIESVPSGVILVNHMHLCDEARVGIKHLFEILGVDGDVTAMPIQYEKRNSAINLEHQFDKSLVKRALEIYSRLDSHQYNLVNI